MKHTPYIIVALFLAACSQTPDNTKKPQEYSMFNENLITANKYLVKQDMEQQELSLFALAKQNSTAIVEDSVAVSYET